MEMRNFIRNNKNLFSIPLCMKQVEMVHDGRHNFVHWIPGYYDEHKMTNKVLTLLKSYWQVSAGQISKLLQTSSIIQHGGIKL